MAAPYAFAAVYSHKRQLNSNMIPRSAQRIANRTKHLTQLQKPLPKSFYVSMSSLRTSVPVSLPDGLSKAQLDSFDPFNVRILTYMQYTSTLRAHKLIYLSSHGWIA